MWITKETDVSQNRMDMNATYQKMFDKAKALKKEDVCMKFYDKTKSLYIETDASGVGIRGCPPINK